MLTFKNNNQDLTIEEFQKISAFLMFLLKNQSFRLRFIYRGINYSNLRETLRLNDVTIDYERINQFLFLIGDKGRAYRQEYQDKIKNKNKQFSINDIGEDIFKSIFKKYQQVLKIKGRPEIEKFKLNNPVFVEYFSSKENANIFLKTIQELPESKKTELRDYYFRPLHHLGVIGFYPNSFFLSTTRAYSVAGKFANHERPVEDPIILHGWVPKPINRIKTFSNIDDSIKMNKLLFKLPTYEKSFFPEQKEISLKGGLLPHYILGYLRPKLKEFEVNPNLFSTSKSFTKIIQEGFDIDQTLFIAALNETDYSDFFTVDENGKYSDTI